VGVATGSSEGVPMIEAILGAALAGNMLMIIAFWVMMKEMRRDLFAMGNKIDHGIENIQVEVPDLDDLRRDIMDVMGSMHTPTFADHLGGMMAQWGQAKLMKSMGEMAPANEMIDQEILHNDQPPST